MRTKRAKLFWSLVEGGPEDTLLQVSQNHALLLFNVGQREPARWQTEVHAAWV